MKKPEIFGNSGLFIAQPGENGENSHCSVGNPNPRIRDQKAAGSNPATSTPRDIENQCSRGFAFPAGFPFFSKSNQLGCSVMVRHEFPPQKIHFRIFPHFSGFFRFENVHFEISCWRWFASSCILRINNKIH